MSQQKQKLLAQNKTRTLISLIWQEFPPQSILKVVLSYQERRAAWTHCGICGISSRATPGKQDPGTEGGRDGGLCCAVVRNLVKLLSG